ncbi:hypothetical protein BDM02DRAFT_3120600 [Thelephora ganbajun]|uniref:Uncharacterized protein n=1 Tax=Thelephora ganbajun TaxID=370292 RepID=A0ACB6Z6E1_THEGA|nr:hypothetical protein BDM02DRAFT_3120600 [Thelephora ganbajun]
MKLPQELVDEIIGHLPTYYPQSLHSCSLVAKSWTHPSQKRLFENINIHPGNFRSWLDSISPTNAVLLGHIRSLSYTTYTTHPDRTIEPAYSALRDYFPSFCQLRRLTLSFDCTPSHPQQIESFSAFQHTLSDLSLSNRAVTTSTLVTLINYFPNLACLYLRNLSYRREAERTSSPPRSPFKKLYVTEWPVCSLDLLDELSKLGLHFDEVAISQIAPTHTWPEFAKRVVDAFGAGAKRLRLHGSPQHVDHSLTLSHCRELREFEIYAPRPNDTDLNLISSITPTNIQKIILTHSTAFRFSAAHTYWTRFDDVLIQLINRSEYKLRLEVEFQGVYDTRGEKSVLKMYLPRFHEKGRVTILSTRNELIYCSDEARGRR